MKRCAASSSIDANTIVKQCERYGADRWTPLVWLVFGNVHKSIESTTLRAYSTTESLKLFDIYESMLHRIANHRERIDTAIALLTHLSVSNEHINRIIDNNFDAWSSIIVALMHDNRNNIHTNIADQLKLRAIRNCSTTNITHRIEIDQSMIVDRDVVYYWHGCEHVTTNRQCFTVDDNLSIDIINRKLFIDQQSTKCPKCVCNDIVDIVHDLHR